MKKIFYIAFAAAALAAVSCAKNAELDVTPTQLEPGLTLTFSCGDMLTRANTIDGVDNENRVDRIDYFFFPTVESSDSVAADTKPVYADYFEPAAEGLSVTAGTYTVTIEPGVLAKIFPNGADSAMVFAVANYNGEEPLISGTHPVTDFAESELTWGYLHGLEVGQTFTKDGGAGFGLRWPRAMKTTDPNLFFVMSSDTAIELKTSGEYAVQADVPLKRLASKVTATFNYTDTLEVKRKKTTNEVYEIINWVPETLLTEEQKAALPKLQTRVYLSNAICTSTLGGPLTRELNPDGGTETAPWSDRDIFEYAYDFVSDMEEGEVPYYYTYPFEFLQEGDDNQPYLKLVLPWYGFKYVGDMSSPESVTYTAGDPNWIQYKQKEVYYKIVLPRETITEPNMIYEFEVDVNIIGSDKEVKLIGEEYMVKDWSSKDPVSSNVATGRYISLEIPKDEYDVYVDSIGIAFVSSGTVIAHIDSIYQWNYSSTNPTKDLFILNDVFQGAHGKGVTEAQVKAWVTIPNETSTLILDHELCNDINVSPVTKFDAAPYVYVVTLHLEEADDDSFDRTITITQYPAMYIEAETNSTYPTTGSPYGYVWVNNSRNSYGGVHGLTGENQNPNMFIITSTILSDGNQLGDPRLSSVQNNPSSNGTNGWSEEVAAMDGTTRRLTYYYPTNSSGNASTIISPKFRIASSYGVTNSLSNRDNAWYRCASYQEDGYPAGRWRLPTVAEVKYVVNLSANGFMDALFGNKDENQITYYWCASGWVGVNYNATEKVTSGTGTPSGQAYARCVYDEWYWSDKAPDKAQFTWGDKLR